MSEMASGKLAATRDLSMRRAAGAQLRRVCCAVSRSDAARADGGSRPAQAVRPHVADSLVGAGDRRVCAAARDRRPRRRAPGSRACALAIALPGARVSLVESQRRKCDFMRRCRRERGSRTRSSCARGRRSGRTGWARNDVVLARALAPQPVVLEYAAPLLRLGGTLVDWRGRRNASEDGRGARAAERARPAAARDPPGCSRSRARRTATCTCSRRLAGRRPVPAPGGRGAQAPARRLSPLERVTSPNLPARRAVARRDRR